MSKTNSGTDLLQKEWQTARDVLSQFDDRQNDLRKNGFTFITGLLTAQSLLASYLVFGAPSTVQSVILPSVKLAVIWATLILVVALRLLDRNYQLFQKAAAIRAEIIERALNLELTETITEVYKHDAMWLFINIAYLLFAAAAGLLGWFLLEGNRWEQYWVLAATVAAWVAIGLIQGLVKLEDRIDITFDKLKVNKGDSLVITMTNLGKKRHISQGSLEWYMQTQDGKDLSHQKSPTRDLNLGAGEPYCLEWDTTPTTITPGFYRFVILENKEARIQGGAVLRKIQVVPPPVLPPGTAGSAKT